MVRLIAATAAPVDTYRAFLYRHPCQSSIITVTRHRAQRGHSTRSRWCVEYLVTILRGHQRCPAVGPIPACHDKACNTLMVEPPKATKGRRMSKKTRKKSPKSASRKATRAPSKMSTKKPAAKTRKETAKKARKGADKKPRKATVKASHKAPSKTLKSQAPGESEDRTAAESKTTAATSKTENPTAAKPPGGKTGASTARQSVLADNFFVRRYSFFRNDLNLPKEMLQS